MKTLGKEISVYLNRVRPARFSSNKWTNLAIHWAIGLCVGILISVLRDIPPMPALLLCSTATAAWGWRSTSG